MSGETQMTPDTRKRRTRGNMRFAVCCAAIAVAAVVVTLLFYRGLMPEARQSEQTPAPALEEGAYQAWLSEQVWRVERATQERFRVQEVDRAAGIQPVITVGLPGEGDVSAEAALALAADAIMAAYGLAADTLVRFVPEAAFFVEDGKNPQWMIHLDPADMRAFAELGTYGAYIDARTGEVLYTYGPEDAVG